MVKTKYANFGHLLFFGSMMSLREKYDSLEKSIEKLEKFDREKSNHLDINGKKMNRCGTFFIIFKSREYKLKKNIEHIYFYSL